MQFYNQLATTDRDLFRTGSHNIIPFCNPRWYNFFMESFNNFRSPIDEEPEYPPANGLEVEEMEMEDISLEGGAEDMGGSDDGQGEKSAE